MITRHSQSQFTSQLIPYCLIIYQKVSILSVPQPISSPLSPLHPHQLSMHLNPAQTEAVTRSGIQLIIAGPGSGKTRVIVEKILHLLAQGVPQHEILALTFSEKAASEMATRLEETITLSDLTVSTFHAFCLSVLEENVAESGRSVAAGVIGETGQMIWAIRNIDAFGFTEIEIGNNQEEALKPILDGISRFRDELVTADDLASYLAQKEKEDLPEEERQHLGRLADLLKVYRAYEAYKRDVRMIDYDDMIHLAVTLFERKPQVLGEYRRRFRYILVDEFQDTNYAQFALLRQLAGDEVFVVGDDDQSIYRFRGAYYGNFEDFRETWKDHQLTILSENYRNSGNILALSRQFLGAGQEADPKVLRTVKEAGAPVVVAECEDEQTEAVWVADEIERLVASGYQFRDIAILTRKRAFATRYSKILNQRGIPTSFSGEIGFKHEPIIRDVLAYLRCIENPQGAGISLNRLMRRAGVSEKAIQQINQEGRSRSWGDDVSDGILHAMEECDTIVAEDSRPALHDLVRTLASLRNMRDDLTLSQLLYEVLIATGGFFFCLLDECRNRDRMLLFQFYEMAQEYEAVTPNAEIRDFLEYVEVHRRLDDDDLEAEEGDHIQIMTLHKSKGKEFPIVFIPEMSERKFPSEYRRKRYAVPPDLARGRTRERDEKALFQEEERRLCYVGMTRAIDRLYLTRSKWYGENKKESKPSIFLTRMHYTDNPRICLVEVPTLNPDILVEPRNDLAILKGNVQQEAVSALSGMRLATALQRITELEKIRMIEEGADPSRFDQAAFLAVPECSRRIEEWYSGTGTHPVALPARYSASSLKTYDSCPLKFKFQHVLKIPSQPRIFFDFGSVMHTVIEHLGKMKKEGNVPTRHDAHRVLSLFWPKTAFLTATQEQEKKETAIRILDTYLAWEQENENSVLSCEESFTFSLGDTTFTGSIDRIEQTPGAAFRVIDFKTGKKPSTLTKAAIPEEIQLNLYSLALHTIHGTLPERASFFYLEDGKFVDYTPTAETIRGFEEKLTRMMTAIRNREFSPKPGWGCQYCDYAMLCERLERGEGVHGSKAPG